MLKMLPGYLNFSEKFTPPGRIRRFLSFQNTSNVFLKEKLA